MESLASSIQEHFVRAIESSGVLTFPFPHLAVDNILPPQVFQRLSASLPPFQTLVPMSQTGWSSVAAYSRRGTLPFSELKNIEDVEIWQSIRTALDSSCAEECLVQKFSSLFDAEIRSRLVLPLRREVRVHCDLEGSHMTPHTDAPSMFITSFIYTQSRQTDDSLDTLLFTPRNPKERLALLEGKEYGHENPDWHLQTGRVQFRPNRMFSFLRTKESVHGFGPVSKYAAPRYLISLHLKYAKEIGL